MILTSDFKNMIAVLAASKMTQMGLLDTSNVELSGGSPPYTRKDCSWYASGEDIFLASAVDFNIPPNVTVASAILFDKDSGIPLASIQISQHVSDIDSMYTVVPTFSMIRVGSGECIPESGNSSNNTGSN